MNAETLRGLTETASASAERTMLPGPVHRRELVSGTMSAPIVYRPCPACGDPMHRRNFARISGVIVDMCGPHGTFFDAGELEDVIAFIQSGGLTAARRAMQDEEAREVRLRASTPALPALTATPLQGPLDLALAWELEFALARGFAGWLIGWIRRLVA